jgi:hypothetical protein
MPKPLSPARYDGRVSLYVEPEKGRGRVFVHLQEDGAVCSHLMLVLTPTEAREVGEQLCLAAAEVEHVAEPVSA